MSVELHLDNVSKSFAPAICALNEVSLTVAAGECLALVGPSGCGKTTLLRVIAGIEQPTSGRVLIDGRCVNDLPCHQRGVSMLFQRPALIPQQTVRHNLRWAWTLRQPWRLLLGAHKQHDDDLLRVARLLDLEQDLDRPIQQLSGGQQQRVALGRCLLRRAKVCLLDEPLGHLDAPLRTELRRQMRSLARDFRVTTIHVTHDPAEAFSVGDRVAVMQQGRIVQVDEPMQMRRRPANRFVAELVHHHHGGLNLLAGRICRQEGSLFFENAFGRWPISLPILQTLRESLYQGENFQASGGKVDMMIGIAVNDVRCSSDLGGAEDDVQLPLSVEGQEISGAGNGVIGADARGRWIGQAGRGERFHAGQAVTMAFSMERAYWFDSTTGRTLLAPR